MEGKVFTFDSTTRAFRACVGVVGGRSCHAVLETTTNNYSPLSLSSVDVLVLLLLTSCVACCTAAESSGGNGNNEHSMATESNIIQLELSYSRALILHTRQRPINHVPSSKKMPSNFLLFQLFH